MSDTVVNAKKNAGYYAAGLVADDMVVGLGTGSTVLYTMEKLAERIKSGEINILGIPTSIQTAMRARKLGIPLTTLDEYPDVDIAIDGADQVDPAFNLIKGRGAAQTRERCLAECAKRFVVVVDGSKITQKLSGTVPVEVIPFAMTLVCERLKALGGNPNPREGAKKDGPVITDNGNIEIDCEFGDIDDPKALQTAINNLPGVVSCGIFTEFKEKTVVVVGTESGIEIL
ncbi:ribose-5-phosphate isomerase RpiA [Methanomicrobium mobile]|uniref:ribose-5-phosphate isomerase RpiA n=1 Tax=Methanomicrobium mobile TaxID=2205 RepID=UPI0005B25C58|nr:ribose-5-phosphate isomerase RpiA [Methanomicrobium mobile]